jgi:urea transport system substrate-binding protein
MAPFLWDGPFGRYLKPFKGNIFHVQGGVKASMGITQDNKEFHQQPGQSRRQLLRTMGASVGLLALNLVGMRPASVKAAPTDAVLKVGILHSLTGTMGTSGQSLVDAIVMAIDEVNLRGGVRGQMLHPVIEDGKSTPAVFAHKAKQLIHQDRVHTVFGCWTSASRKAVLPVVEQANHLLWYPVQYEGYEQSPAIMYGGAAPNQQIIPAVEWGMSRFGRKVFLVGSDYVFPRTANKIIKKELQKRMGHLSGESYRPLGSQDFASVVKHIKKVKPNFIINTINGDGNRRFFQEMKTQGLSASTIPIVSMSVAEDELQNIGPEYAQGHFAAWNYFQSIDTPSNHQFVTAFKKRYGQDRVTGDPIGTAYSQVHMYALAVEKAKSTNPQAVARAARGMIWGAPEGLIRVDPHNQHTWKVARIGQIQGTGQFRIV